MFRTLQSIYHAPLDGQMCNLRVNMQPVTSVSSKINGSNATKLDLIGFYLPLTRLLWKCHQISEVPIDWHGSADEFAGRLRKPKQRRNPHQPSIFLVVTSVEKRGLQTRTALFISEQQPGELFTQYAIFRVNGKAVSVHTRISLRSTASTNLGQRTAKLAIFVWGKVFGSRVKFPQFQCCR